MNREAHIEKHSRGTWMTRVQLQVVLLAIGIACVPFTARAQSESDVSSPSLPLVEWSFTASRTWTESPAATVPAIRFLGSVPLDILLPQTTPDSRIEFGLISAGVRNEDGATSEAWSVGLLDLLLQRSLWSGSVSLIQLSSNTLLDTDRTWFEIGTGPGFHLQRDQSAFSGRLRSLGGRRSVETSRSNHSYRDEHHARDHEREHENGHDGHHRHFAKEKWNGWHGGLAFEAATRLGSKVSASSRLARTWFTDGNDPLDELQSNVSVRVSNHWVFSGVAHHILNEDNGRVESPWMAGVELTYRFGVQR